MKIYLKDCKTDKFMRCDSQWTADITEALDFLSEQRAFLFGLQELKESFHIVKIRAAELLPAIIPQLTIPQIPCARIARPLRAAHRLCEQILSASQARSSAEVLRIMPQNNPGISARFMAV
jgi:hypothetical protein